MISSGFDVARLKNLLIFNTQNLPSGVSTQLKQQNLPKQTR